MNLIEQLKQIPDHRSGHGKRYPLWWLLWVVILGSLCGYRGYRPLRDFCQANWESLSEWSEAAVPRTHPSYSTLRRLVMQVDSSGLLKCLTDGVTIGCARILDNG